MLFALSSVAECNLNRLKLLAIQSVDAGQDVFSLETPPPWHVTIFCYLLSFQSATPLITNIVSLQLSWISAGSDFNNALHFEVVCQVIDAGTILDTSPISVTKCPQYLIQLLLILVMTVRILLIYRWGHAQYILWSTSPPTSQNCSKQEKKLTFEHFFIFSSDILTGWEVFFLQNR